MNFGLAQGAKFICLGDYANSRGAADMGLYPDMLPGYAPVSSATSFHEEWLDEIPQYARLEPAADDGRRQRRQAEGAVCRRLQSDRALQRRSLSPCRRPSSWCRTCSSPRRPAIADVVLPVANAYEKGGTFTNTCGDVQMLKKAGEFAGRAQRLRVHRAHRRSHGIRRTQAGAVWRRRHARRHGPDAAARNRAKPTGTRCGWPSTISSRR